MLIHSKTLTSEQIKLYIQAHKEVKEAIEKTEKLLKEK